MDFKGMTEFFTRATAPMRRKINLMVSRAVISAIKDSKNTQFLQVSALSDEVLDDVERFSEFGFSSNPPSGTEAVLLSVGGNREHSIIVATNHRASRFKNLASGESVLYTNDGTHIHLKKGGEIEIKTSTKVFVDAPDVEFTGNALVKGNLTVEGAIIGQTTAVITGLITGGGVATTAGGSVVSAGNVTGGGTDLATIKSVFNTHTHKENDINGQTNGPSGTV